MVLGHLTVTSRKLVSVSRLSIVVVLALVLTSVYSITRGDTPRVKAAAPTTLNFQGRLLASSGNLVPDGQYNIEFKLYNASTSSGSSQGSCTGDANCLWTETRYDSNGVTAGNDNRVEIKNGYFSAYLGDISSLPTNIWHQQLWLTLNVGGSAQTASPTWDGEMTPRIRLTSVPYAFRATVAESAETLYKNTGSFAGTVDFATMTANRTFLFPDTSLATTASPGTICVFNGTASNCPAATGSAFYIQNTAGSATPQTSANFNIQATDSGANGTVVGIFRGAAGGQTVDLAQFQASNGTVLGAVTAAGNLQVASSVDTRTAGTLSLGTSTATAITLGKSGITTTNAGALTVTELGTFNGGLTSASNFTVTPAGNVAFQRNTTDFTAVGTQDDVNLGTGALFRLNGASAQTITSIQGGVDGRIITLVNAGANAATIQNDSGGTAANRIVTGTGGNLSLPTGASIQLTYDSSASRWRVVGGIATSGGGANQQLSNLSGTVAINASLTPGTDNTLDLGSSANSWRTLYADTSVLTPAVDTASATTLSLGTTTATAITLGRSGITTTNAGALTVTQLLTGNAGATINGGAISLTGNAASSLTTSSGALTLTSAAAATWSTAAGNLTVDSAATLQLGTSTATGVTIGSNGITTVNGGNFQFAQGANRTLNVAANASNAAGYNLTIGAGAAGTGAGAFGGGTVTIQGGAAAGTGNANGGDVVLQGGAGVGTGVSGNINLGKTVYSTAATQTSNVDVTLTQSVVDSYSSIPVEITSANKTVTLPDPHASTPNGRILYITAVPTSTTFTLSMNGGALSFSVGPNTGATLIWNNGDWANAGVDSGSASYIQNQNSVNQSGNFRINGTGRANTSFVTPLVDAISGTLGLGTTGASTTGVSIGNTSASFALESNGTANLFNGNTAHTIQLGAGGTSTAQIITIGSTNATSTTLIQGGTSATGLQLQVGSGGTIGIANNAVSQNVVIGNSTGGTITLGQNGGTVAINGTNFDVSTAGVVTLPGGQAIDVVTAGATALTIDTGGAAALNLATTNANAVSISRTGVTTTVNGALTVTQLGTFNGGLTAASNFTVTNAGNVAFQRNTTDFTATGVQDDVSLGTGALFRLNGASAQTITSIQGGVDGRVITLINAGANTATIQNDSGGTATNRIITGTGGNLSVPSGASIQLTYDSSASRWRVVGSSATGGGGANQQLSNLSGTIAINASLTPDADNSLDLGSSSFSWRTLYADTSVLSPRLDTATAVTLNIGNTTASAITLGHSGITTTNGGALTVTELLTANAGATVSGGAISLTGNAASSLTTSSGALTLTSAAAAVWSTTAGNLTVDSAAALQLGTTNATSVSISKTGVTTTVNGALTVTQAGTFNGGITAASNLTVTNAGNVAFQRNTTDFTATGVQDDVNLGTGVLFRINGATAQTITSIQGGADGRVITIVNAGTNAATIQNDSGGTATNRIITGTGGNLSVPAGASIELAYDSSASRWRIIGGSATSGGGANQQLSNLSGTIAINTHLNPDADNTLDLGSGSYSWRTLYADTSVLAPRLDTTAATTLNIGNTTANAITIGHSGITTTNGGALTVTELLTANAGATVSGGAISLTGNAASSFTTSSGALTLTSAAAAVWSTAAGNLTVDSAAALNLGTTNATSVSISKTGVTTTVNGALTVTQLGTFNGGLTAASNFTVTNAGNVAFQRNTTDFTATGTQDDISLGSGVLFRLNGATAQTITSIQGGADGRVITLVNAGANAATIQNDSGGTATNRIITGTGGNLSVPSGATIQLAYDSSANRWRVVGGSATSGGGANQQLSNLSGTIAVNASLNPGTDNTLDLGSAANSWQTIYADTSVLTPRIDTASATTLLIGNTTANAITLGYSGITTTNAGALTVSELLTGSAGATIGGGAIALTGNAASSFTTSTGALTITSAAAATWSTAAGNLTVDSAAALQLGTTNATSVSISKTGVTTTVNGALTVTQLGTFNGGLTVASDFTVTQAGNVAFQRNTTDYTAVGTQDSINFGTGALFRITSASALTINGVAGGADGRIITLVNASSNAVSIANNASGTAANHVTTGTGGTLSVPAGSSVQLAYDSAASLWRVIGGTATAGGAANQQLSNLSGTVAVNLDLNPGGDNARDLGSSSNSWKTLYADTSVLTPTVDTATATTLNIGTTTANAVSISRTGVTTTVNGALTVTQAGTFNGGLTAASNLTVTNAGNVAFQANATSYTVTGTQELTLGSGVLHRVTSATATPILTGLTGGADGRIITLMNASGNTFTIQNDSGGTATNRIITGSGINSLVQAGGSVQLAYDSASSRWRIIGSSGGDSIQLQATTPGTAQTGNFNVSGTGIAGTAFYSPMFDTATAVALGIGTTNATNVTIGHNAGTFAVDGTNFDLSTAGVITLAGGQSRDITTATTGTATALTVRPGDSTTANIAGGALNLQGGSATAGNANGGTVTISGGAGFGTGAQGLVALSTSAFTSPGATITFSTDNDLNTLSAGAVNLYSNVVVSASTTGKTLTIPVPTIQTNGRLLYVAVANGSNDFTLALANTSGVPSSYTTINMKGNNTATLIWNGYAWTAAGASSSTDLQSAYNNTLTSAGGAEIVLNPVGGNADGFTIRNNGTTPIIGGLLEVQSSTGSNLLSVNNNATEYAVNGGAETASMTGWSNTTGGVITQNTNATYNATGQASVSVVTTSSATNHGAKNTLSAALSTGVTYSVSFAVKGTLNFSTLQVIYSPDGGTSGTTCATAQTVTQANWSRIVCTFVASGSINSSNAILIRQTDSASHTYYVDNLSVQVNANMTFAAEGSVNSSLGTAWTTFNAGGGSPTSQSGTVYDGQYAVSVPTTGATQGIRNNMAVTPAVNTQYLVTFYAKSSSGTASIAAGFLPAGGNSAPVTAQQCVDYNTQSVPSTGWQRITCVVTAPSSGISDPDIVIYQTDGTTRNLYVDALTITLNTNNANNVQVGGVNKGGPTTLLTLDRAGSAPIAANNDAYLGSMYYDTTTGRIQCYEADGWGACGSSPDNIITLTPEYAGAVLGGPGNGGAAGIGVMTSEFCSTETGVLTVGTLCADNEARNFYRWTSPQATEQVYSIYVSYKLPSTFKEFNDSNTIKLTALSDNLTNAIATLQVFRKPSNPAVSIASCGSATTINTAINSWEQTSFGGDERSCSFAAGDNIIFKIDMKSKSNGNIYVENLDFVYNNN